LAVTAKNPYDRELSNLIGQLSTRSDALGIGQGSDAPLGHA
jgi:hypothetical protein